MTFESNEQNIKSVQYFEKSELKHERKQEQTTIQLHRVSQSFNFLPLGFAIGALTAAIFVLYLARRESLYVHLLQQQLSINKCKRC